MWNLFSHATNCSRDVGTEEFAENSILFLLLGWRSSRCDNSLVFSAGFSRSGRLGDAHKELFGKLRSFDYRLRDARPKPPPTQKSPASLRGW
jgi:hypothetical protein